MKMLTFSVPISDQDDEYLASCARIRKMNKNDLVTQIINTVAHDQMVLSVMDDNSQPSKLKSSDPLLARLHDVMIGIKHDPLLAKLQKASGK